MKHTLKITIILLSMFLVTQFIGLYVVNHYSPIKFIDGKQVDVTAPDLPFGLESPEIEQESDYGNFFISIIIAMIIAVCLLFFLSKFKAEFFLRVWFLVVVIVAMVISFLSIIPLFEYALVLALVIAVPLGLIKIYGKNFIVHNFTELFIYPGIAAIFVPILNLFWVIALLIVISLYDMWAVWQSKIMVKMAKFQVNKLKIFAGFFVPQISKTAKMKLKNMSKSKLKKAKVQATVAILGGGDVIFPLIATGVVLKTLGLGHALFIILGSTLSLSGLFFLSTKNKWYPAMPFITVGVLIGLGLGYLIL